MQVRLLEPENNNIDISQDAILPHFIRYLEQKKNDDDYDDVVVDRLIKELKTGCCAGFSALAVYCLWLETQPKKDTIDKPIFRDDWTWFQSTLQVVSRLKNRESPLSKIEKDNIERFLSSIVFFQKVIDYLSVGQGELEKCMEDTRNRKIIKEYSLAGLFTFNQFKNMIKKIIHEDRCILMESHNHEIGLFRKNNYIIFYDSNNKCGINIYQIDRIDRIDQVDQLSTDIYSAMGFIKNIPSPFRFRAFSFDGKSAAKYPSHAEILAKLPLISSVSPYADDETALFVSAEIGCIESVKIYIKRLEKDKSYLDKACAGLTPVSIAVYNGHVEVLELLLKNGADLNKEMNDGRTPAHIAAKNGCLVMLEFLLKNGADLNKEMNDGATPADIATKRNHLEAIAFFRKIGAKFNQEDCRKRQASNLGLFSQGGNSQPNEIIQNEIIQKEKDEMPPCSCSIS